ncbi:MAG: histidine phosphatase family protein [Lactovum sp.]
MRLYLVRHGETYLNKYNRMQGWADTPLTKKGKELARSCGELLKAYEIHHMITSDLGRTIETAKEIGEVLGLKNPAISMPEFRESFFGYYEGADAKEAWDEAAKKSGFQSVNDLYQNGSMAEVMNIFHQADDTGDAESYLDFRSRLKEGLTKIQENYDSQEQIVLVTHGNTIRNIAYMIDPTINCAEVLVNAGITIIEIDEGSWKIINYNQAPQLDKRKDML